MASVVVLKKFVNLHYNRGVAGARDFDRFNNSSRARFARRPQAFDVHCDLHSQTHKHNLRTPLKKRRFKYVGRFWRYSSFSTVSNSATASRFKKKQLLASFTSASLDRLPHNVLYGEELDLSLLFSTYWTQWFLLLLLATWPLTPCHWWLSYSHCVRLGKNNARLSCLGPTHLAWPAPAVGCVCGFVENLHPASLIRDPFLCSAVDTSLPLRCTTWNGNVFGPNREYIHTGNLDAQKIGSSLQDYSSLFVCFFFKFDKVCTNICLFTWFVRVVL